MILFLVAYSPIHVVYHDDTSTCITMTRFKLHLPDKLINMIKWGNLVWSAWPVSAIWVTLKPHVQCTYIVKNHSHSSTKMSLENIVDEICQKSFDFLEEFCQCETNCVISCTIDGQNNLVDIKIIIKRNEKIISNSNFYIRGQADTELFTTFLSQIQTLFWKSSKMGLHSYFTEL